MAIIVEDGTEVANANSYVDVQGLRDFAALRGLTVPVADGDCEVLLIKAIDVLEGLKWIGDRKTTTQVLDWPRINAVTKSDNFLLDDSRIPPDLIKGQCQLAYIAQSIDLQPTQAQGAKGPVMSESVYGAVSRTYAQPSSATSLKPYLPSVSNFLQDLLRSGFGMGPIFSVRV